MHRSRDCSDNNLRVAEHAFIVQPAPTDNLKKPLERWDLAVSKEELNDLVDDIWEWADLLVNAVPQLFRQRHMWLLRAVDAFEKQMLGEIGEDEFQGVPKAKLIFSLVEK